MARRTQILSMIGDLGFGGAENRLLTLARNRALDRIAGNLRLELQDYLDDPKTRKQQARGAQATEIEIER